MKRFFTLFFILFTLSNFNVKSYPPYISYILPDIVAPGMNSCIEIMGPKLISIDPLPPIEFFWNFGPDSLYFNNPNDPVKVELVRPEDSSKITIGPLIVSWKGRMITAQVFAKPSVNPNSRFWQDLRPEFRIPIRVYKYGEYSNVDTIYLVQPQNLGDVSSNSERVIGQGTLGIRSRRGAMIIDSLKLATATTYTISNNDCDPNTSGNQGWLPFVLISKEIGRASCRERV